MEMLGEIGGCSDFAGLWREVLVGLDCDSIFGVSGF